MRIARWFALVAAFRSRTSASSLQILARFRHKVPVYPGYVCAVVASLTLVCSQVDRDRSENLQSTGFARDYHMTAEVAADKDGRKSHAGEDPG